MACKVEKFQSTGKGRGLRVTSAASPGDILYVAEPFVYTVMNAGCGKLCEFCLSPNDQLLQCSQCKFAKYCGKQCQAEAWLDHKRECKCLKRAKSNFDTQPFRMVGKIIFKVLRKTPCPSEKLCSLSDLESNLEKLSSELKSMVVNFAECLHLYLNEDMPADINLAELYAKEITNRFEIVHGNIESAAVGLYPSMSLLNHSCEPNCTVAFMGRHLHLRATGKIQKGEELTISYIYPLQTTEERQSELMFKYCFKCDCRRCRTCDKDENMLAGDKQLSGETKELEKKLQHLQAEQKWKEILHLCKAQLRRNRGWVPDENIYQLTILSYAMKACMHLGLPEEGLYYGNRTLEPYKMYTTGISDTTGERMFHLGNMLISLGKIDEAVTTFQEAYEILKVFKGTDHPKTQTVISFLHRFHTYKNIKL